MISILSSMITACLAVRSTQSKTLPKTSPVRGCLVGDFGGHGQRARSALDTSQHQHKCVERPDCGRVFKYIAGVRTNSVGRQFLCIRHQSEMAHRQQIRCCTHLSSVDQMWNLLAGKWVNGQGSHTHAHTRTHAHSYTHTLTHTHTLTLTLTHT